MKVRRIKSGSAVEFYINDEQTVLYNKKGGVLGRYMNCAPLPLSQKIKGQHAPRANRGHQSLVTNFHPFLYTTSCIPFWYRFTDGMSLKSKSSISS